MLSCKNEKYENSRFIFCSLLFLKEYISMQFMVEQTILYNFSIACLKNGCIKHFQTRFIWNSYMIVLCNTAGACEKIKILSAISAASLILSVTKSTVLFSFFNSFHKFFF